jgi:hypothetical protein
MENIKGILNNKDLRHNIIRKIKEGKYKCTLLQIIPKKKLKS